MMTNVSPRMGHGSGIGCRGRPKGDYFYCGLLGLDIVWISKLFAQFKKNNKILIFQNRFCPNSLLLGFSMFLSQRVCLDWTAVSASLGLSFSCFWPCPPCFPNVLRCCVRPSWACLSACPRSCLSACLPSSVPAQLGCCVCLPGCVSRLVVHVVSHGLGCGVRLLGLVYRLSNFCNCFVSTVVDFFGHILNFTFTNKSNIRVGFRGRIVFFSDLAIILTFLVEKWK